ncbi:hypothetical protein BDR07DRAFT_519194 [Suillus spraguei]|nr:hypothetical protein BDR07DRAFT_519194 [Suillus spraguei]
MGDPGLANNTNNPAFFAGNPTMGISGMCHYSFANVIDPVVDISRFPMWLLYAVFQQTYGMLSTLSKGWCVGAWQTTEGLIGTFVFGAGGNGLLTCGCLPSPIPPRQRHNHHPHAFASRHCFPTASDGRASFHLLSPMVFLLSFY